MAKRILVIDDDDGAREALSNLLQAEGYEPICARHGREGLEQLEQNPDLIILDLMMPVMDGWEFRAQQKQHPKYAKIPVFVFSATPPARIEADAIFTKPVDVDALLARTKERVASG